MATTGHSFDWARHAARLIGGIGGEDLCLRALDALDDLVAFEHTGVFLFNRRRRPRDLLARRTSGAFHRTYCGHTYELDPFYKGAQRLADILPPGASRERRAGSGRLAEEVGFLMPVGAGRVVHIALIRSTAIGPFGDDELRRLREFTPVLEAAFEVHFRRLPQPADEPDGESAVDAHACPEAITARLSAREAEVAEHLLAGLATEHIAARLSIADGTVKVHRRNIYRKLHVGSRGELLSLCRAARR
jgi:DNA-binding CsgD family transcriptional regulator